VVTAIRTTENTLDTPAQLFSVEQEVFQEHLPQWLAHDVGRFVLIHGTDVSGPYDTQRDAITVGYQSHGNVPFLTKEIQPFERALAFTRSVLSVVA